MQYKSLRKLSLIFVLLASMIFVNTSHAAAADKDIKQLRTQWAIAKYQTPRNQQINKFERLISQAEALNNRYPNDPEVLMWHGTILSTYASIKGGLKVLPHVKKARSLLEKAISLQSNVGNGFAHGVIGALYARVPGWPIAFGNKKTAGTYLQTAVRLSPQGSDSNYYYGDYLVDIGKYDMAARHLQTALKAPIRSGYEIQDRGRKGEINASLRKLQRFAR